MFKTSISLYTDIVDFSISTNAPSISVYDIEDFLLRYRISCSSISVFFCRIQPGLPTRYRTHAHCTANQSLPVAHVPPGPPSAAAAEAALGGATAPAAPGAAPAAAAGAGLGRWNGCRSRRSGHQRNAGARDSWRQELTGAKFAAAGAAAAAAARAGINGTQERVILGDKNLLASSLE
jgi:hypothetical protein